MFESAAPTPHAVVTAPRLTLNRPVPCVRKQWHRQGPGGDRNCAGDHQRPLGGRPIDESAHRCLRDDRRDAADPHHEADRGLVPVVGQQEINREVRAQTVANISQKEVQ
jgi:hypothetical protein